MIEMNENATKSYAQVVHANMAERDGLLIHNLPESTEEILADRIISDIRAVYQE